LVSPIVAFSLDRLAEVKEICGDSSEARMVIELFEAEKVTRLGRIALAIDSLIEISIDVGDLRQLSGPAKRPAVAWYRLLWVTEVRVLRAEVIENGCNWGKVTGICDEVEVNIAWGVSVASFAHLKQAYESLLGLLVSGLPAV
jgi:hypothetical protein